MNREPIEESGVPLPAFGSKRGPGRWVLSKRGEGGVRFFEESAAAQGFDRLFEKSLHRSPLVTRELLQRAVGEVGDSDGRVAHDVVFLVYWIVYRESYTQSKKVKPG